MNRETLQKITTALFFMGVTIELALVLLDKMRLSPASQGLLFRVTFVLFLGAMLGKRYSRGEWLWFLAFCGIGFVVAHHAAQ